MSHLFLSYSHDDTAFMQKLKRKLITDRFIVWVDENLQPGTPSWMREIKEKIKQSNCFIILLSPKAESSEWVEREIFCALTYNIPIIPVLISGNDQTAIPFLLLPYQRVDMRSNLDFPLAYRTLVQSIKLSLENDTESLSDIDDYSSASVQECFVRTHISLQYLTDSCSRIANVTSSMGEKFKQLSSYPLSAEQNNDTILQSAHDELLTFAQSLELELPLFSKAWIVLLKSISRIFSDEGIQSKESKEAILGFRSQIQILQNIIHQVVSPAIKKLRNTLPQLEGTTRDLDRAGNVAIREMDQLIAAFATGGNYLQEIVELADESIRKFDDNDKSK